MLAFTPPFSPVTDPAKVLTVLLAIEGGVLYLSKLPQMQWFFKYLPSMFWIYFLPMVANTLGLLPAASDVYDAVGLYILPASLVLLLMPVDVRSIVRLGPVAIVLMLAGSVGTFIGGPLVVLMFKGVLPADGWQSLGVLSASWIGGSANMATVKELTHMNDGAFTTAVVVDTLVPYAWMGVLILLSGYQAFYDRHNRSRQTMVDDLAQRASVGQVQKQPVSLEMLGVMAAVVMGVTMGGIYLSGHLVDLQKWKYGTVFVDAKSTGILLASMVGLTLSFTPLRKLDAHGATHIGNLLLYLLLATFGAKANLTNLGGAPWLLVAGAAWIVIHAGFLIFIGRLLRAPMALLATASQANIGGPASAPVVAGIYQPALAPVGLLMALLGYFIGTYMGWACYWLCGLAARL